MRVFLGGSPDALQDHIETVLASGQKTLILDEAQRCFPEGNYRAARPFRLEWIHSQLNRGVPIVLVSTPQFNDLLKAIRAAKRWDANQFVNRVRRQEDLPEQPSASDFELVAASMLPSLPAAALRRVCATLRDLGAGLGTLRTLAVRACCIAHQAGRKAATVSDVRQALGGGRERGDRPLLSPEQPHCMPPEDGLQRRLRSGSGVPGE